MAFQEIGPNLTPQELQKINTNFQQAQSTIDSISGEVLNEVIEQAQLIWKDPVNSFSNLTTTYPSAEVGWTSMTRDSGKVYRYNGSSWAEIQQIDVGPINELDTRFTNQLSYKASKSEARLKTELIGAGDISSELQAQITGTAPVANSIPANQSVTINTVAPETFEEIKRKSGYGELQEMKHGQFINKYVGNNIGIRSLSNDSVDNCTVSFIDSDITIPFPTEKISKKMRLSYTNKTSIFWYKKFAVANVNAPEISGFWINKTDVLKFANIYNLIWFHNSTGTSLLLINPSISTNLLVVGYKKSTVNSGITVTFEVRAELNGWLYIVQTTDKKHADAATIGMGVFLANGPGNITDKVDLVGLTQLEGQTDILPYFIYPETALEKNKTLPEISKAINDLTSAQTGKETVNFGYKIDEALPLLKYRSVLAKRAFQQVIIACIGDSITEGFWSGLNWDRAWPVQLRRLMQAKYGGQDEGFVTVYTDDGRWAQSGTGWTKSSSNGLASARRYSSTTGDKLTFTFNGIGVDIIHSKAPDGGSCVVKIDGVTQAPLDCYAASETLAQTKSYIGLTAGNHTIEISAPTDGKRVYIEGAYVKTVGDTSGIRVDRRAKSGSYTGDWTSALMLQTFDTQPADLFIVAIGINDAGSNRTPEQMKAGLQTLITKLKTKGSVILVPMMQANEVADPRFVNWESYVQKYYELADENDVALIDVYELFGKEYQPAQQYGLFGINNGNGEGNDTIHPSARGQQVIADAIFKLIG